MGKAIGGMCTHQGGCYVCRDVHWDSKNVHGLAAQHHYKTGHQTWVEIGFSYHYGEELQTAPRKKTTGETEDK
jgi:hypothetical protein